MAGIIDSFVIALGFDTKGIDSGNKKVKASLDELKNQVIGLLTLFTAGKGLKEFIEDLTDTDAALGRLAFRIGSTAGELSAWENAAADAGGSAQGMAATIKGLSESFGQFAITGQSSTIPYFRALGVQISDTRGKMRPFGDILLDLSKAVEGLDKPVAVALLKGAGIDDDTINVLLQGRDAVKDLIDEQKKLGIANEQDAKAAQVRLKAWREFNQAATQLGRIIATQLTPALNFVTVQLTKLSEWFQQNPAILEAAFYAITAAAIALSIAMGDFVLGAAVVGVIRGFTLLIGWIPRLLLWLGLLTADTLPALGSALWAVGAAMEATPIGWLVTGLAAVAFVVYYLISHLKELKQAWTDLWTGNAGQAAVYKLVGKDPKFANAKRALAPQAETFQTQSGAPGAGISQYADAIAAVESRGSGNYSAIGPTTGTGDHAYGRYQVMGANIPAWTKAALGKSLTPEEFLASPQAQDAVFQHQFGSLISKFGNANDAASAWFTGRPLAQGANARDVTGTSGLGYVQKFQNALSSIANSQYASNSNSIQIDNISIATQATDANGIAQSIRPAISRSLTTMQAQYSPG